MIQIKKEKITELMFDIWKKSNDLKNPVIVSEYIEKELSKVKNLDISGVIKRIEEYAPKPVKLPEFDLTKKADHIYCVEWGIKKAKRNEWQVYQNMLKELKEKYVL